MDDDEPNPPPCIFPLLHPDVDYVYDGPEGRNRRYEHERMNFTPPMTVYLPENKQPGMPRLPPVESHDVFRVPRACDEGERHRVYIDEGEQALLCAGESEQPFVYNDGDVRFQPGRDQTPEYGQQHSIPENGHSPRAYRNNGLLEAQMASRAQSTSQRGTIPNSVQQGGTMVQSDVNDPRFESSPTAVLVGEAAYNYSSPAMQSGQGTEMSRSANDQEFAQPKIGRDGPRRTRQYASFRASRPMVTPTSPQKKYGRSIPERRYGS